MRWLARLWALLPERAADVECPGCGCVELDPKGRSERCDVTGSARKSGRKYRCCRCGKAMVVVYGRVLAAVGEREPVAPVVPIPGLELEVAALERKRAEAERRGQTVNGDRDIVGRWQ